MPQALLKSYTLDSAYSSVSTCVTDTIDEREGIYSRTQFVNQEVDSLVHRHPQRGLDIDSVRKGKLFLNGDDADHHMRAILPERYCNMFDGKVVVCVEYQDPQAAMFRARCHPHARGEARESPERSLCAPCWTASNNDASGLCAAALSWDHSFGSDFRSLSQFIQCFAISPHDDLHPSDGEVPAHGPRAHGARLAEVLVRDPQYSIVRFLQYCLHRVHPRRHSRALDALGKTVIAMSADVCHVHDDIRSSGKPGVCRGRNWRGRRTRSVRQRAPTDSGDSDGDSADRLYQYILPMNQFEFPKCAHT
ncbi:hypothetical protein DFH09DRAFT_1102159 [Mycena vulgaris]|nr:hypothetical protein DFH09DRAFT_1102159 [Mycena vulgaris]